MTITLHSGSATEAAADWLIAALPEADALPAAVAELDTALDGRLTRLKESGDLTGKLAEVVKLPDATGIAAKRLLLIGTGKPAELDVPKLEKAARTAARAVSDKENVTVAVLPAEATESVPAATIAEVTARAFVVGCVGQDLYRQEPGRHAFASITLVADGGSSEAVERGHIIGEAINLAREVVNRPAADIYPESFAERAQQMAGECGLECTILDEAQLAAEKMGSLMAVAQGSDRPPRIVCLKHAGGGDGKPTLALVGKGVTFDSGGLSLKPSDGMLAMKCDMAGAAAVLGAMSAIARLKLPVNVVGYAGLVENMVSGNSYKLGDVLTARNGTTIEVHNTDAEGRLVLADVLSYAVDQGADRIIDLATLTGACMVALGEEVTGVFTNDESWSESVLSAARTAGEFAWPMPMHPHFGELLKSDVADCKNVGPRWGGAITAAKFLEKFVSKTPWVHLDIAGPAFASSNKPEREGGGTGAMVATLVEVATAL